MEPIAIATAARRAERKRAIIGWGLVMPALLYLAVTFVFPILGVLAAAVSNGGVARTLPLVTQQLAGWNGDALPGDEIADALIADLRNGGRGEIAGIARDLNNRAAGYREMMLGSRSALAQNPEARGMPGLVEADRRWGDVAYWHVLRAAVRPVTPFYLLAALDLRQADDGSIRQALPERRIYLQFLTRTFEICVMVTLICAVVGYPVAYLMATSSRTVERVLLFLVLIPFWTSVLVRTAAWVIVLQRDGLVNGLLMGSGLTSQSIPLVYNRFGVYVAMVHVLLPFMVLPIYSVMKSINPQLQRAALSLGARPYVAFLLVYLPLSLPGLSAGATMVFVLGLGYYITPALVGGPTDQMQSGLIADFALGAANWPMASAISIVLLSVTGILFFLLKRLLRVGNLGIG